MKIISILIQCTLSLSVVLTTTAFGQGRGINSDPTQKSIGKAPYEMEGRKETRVPTITFDDCTRWQVKTKNADAQLYRTQEQKIVGMYSGKVHYRTRQRKAMFRVELIKPIKMDRAWDCVNLWNYGNHWLWENSGEAMTHHLVIKDGNDSELVIPFISEGLWRNMNYKYWTLSHIKLGDSIVKPITLIGLEFAGNSTVPNQENQIYLGPLYAYKEELKPMQFKPFPEKLPFPLRTETMLPINKEENYTNTIKKVGEIYQFGYNGKDASLLYELDPLKVIGGVSLSYNGWKREINKDAHIFFDQGTSAEWQLTDQKLQGDTLFLTYNAKGKGFSQNFACSYVINQKSLIWTIQELSETGLVEEIYLGTTSKVKEGKLIAIPSLVYKPFANDTYNPEYPELLYTDGLFYFTMFDFYYTNASEYYADKKFITNGHANYNGGVKYHQLINKRRNPLRERLFINVSPDVHEVFPTIDNPRSPMRSNQADRLWYVNGSHVDTLQKTVASYRSKGIERVSLRLHEESWREGGESYTFKLEPNPQIGVEKTRNFIRFAQNLGWRVGLYTNYMDFAPVNSLWNEDWVRISRSGNWGNAWCRCYAPKVTIGWEQQAILAPQIHKKFGTNFSYCDVETCYSPMDRVDYDPRTPGAGKFRTVFEYIGMTLMNERRAYQAPVYSEGGSTWFYAGLADGNYLHIANRLPIFPDFQLLKIHPLEMDALAHVSGLSYIPYAFAFGCIGMVSNELDETIRRYAFLQPMQKNYAMIPVLNISYCNGNELVSSSQAIKEDLLKAPKIEITYASGLKVYTNFSDSIWQIKVDNQPYSLPKYGVFAYMPESNQRSFSIVNNNSKERKRLDLVFSESLYYMNSYGERVDGPLGGNGSYLLKLEEFGWEIIPAGDLKVVDFDLSLLHFEDLGVDIEIVDKEGYPVRVINDVPISGRVKFEHMTDNFKYRICPVKSL